MLFRKAGGEGAQTARQEGEQMSTQFLARPGPARPPISPQFLALNPLGSHLLLVTLRCFRPCASHVRLFSLDQPALSEAPISMIALIEVLFGKRSFPHFSCCIPGVCEGSNSRCTPLHPSHLPAQTILLQEAERYAYQQLIGQSRIDRAAI